MFEATHPKYPNARGPSFQHLVANHISQILWWPRFVRDSFHTQLSLNYVWEVMPNHLLARSTTDHLSRNPIYYDLLGCLFLLKCQRCPFTTEHVVSRSNVLAPSTSPSSFARVMLNTESTVALSHAWLQPKEMMAWRCHWQCPSVSDMEVPLKKTHVSSSPLK